MNLKKILSNPLNVFLFIWVLILFTFQLNISYFFPKYTVRELLLPFFSIFYFILGFMTVKLFKKKKYKIKYCVHFCQRRFNLFILILIMISLIIVIINIVMFGPPPLMSIFGYHTTVYLEYGRFKGLLFSLLIFIFVSSLYGTKRISYFLKLFSITILLLYISRGNIIFSILTYFFLLIYENRITNKKLFYLSMSLIIIIIVLFQIVGEFRTGTEAFYNVLEIKDIYRIKNSGLIWLISYVSMPFVNLLEVSHYDHLFWGQNIISRSLPAFLSFNQESVEFYKSILPNQYNTAPSYLTPIYLDFGITGFVLYNFFLGAISSYVYHFGTNNLIKSIFITAISLIFFTDYFLFFTTIILIVLSIFFNKFIYIKGLNKCLK